MQKRNKIKNWIRITDEGNAYDYLSHVNYILAVQDDSIFWKWLSICLHGALYGFALSVAKWSDPVCIYKERNQSKGIVDIRVALSRCINLNQTANQKLAVDCLCDTLRNNFIHFQVNSWIINTKGLPQKLMDVLDQIEKLALKDGRRSNLPKYKLQNIQRFIKKIRKNLESRIA
jgi:hypothetical protein